MDFAQGSQSDVFSAATTMPRARQPLRAHPAFAPMLGVWGAGVGAAIALVLPVPVIEAFAASMPADLPAQTARTVLAGGTALALALVAYGAGRALCLRRGESLVQPAKQAAVEPIDPTRELGSESFDAPLPAGLFAKEPDWLPEPPAPDTLAAEAAAELAELSRPARATHPELQPEPAPRELDLADFGALPGRNAVWVEEPVMPEHAFADDLTSAADPFEPNPDPALVSAIARLRAVPPAELSLCEMVERLAAALQDYQSAQEARSDGQDNREEREALLSEALGALGRVTSDSRAHPAAASSPALRAQLWAEADGLSQQRGAA